MRRPSVFLSIGLLLCAGALRASVVMADCDTGTTSTCGNNVSLSISSLVRITNIGEMDFGSYSGVGDLVQDDDVCIWTNVDTGNYRIKAQGDGVDNAFTVAHSGNVIQYTVKWNNTTGTSGNSLLAPGIFSGTLSGASTTSSTCGGGVNANFQVRIAGSELLSASPGVYSGVLTLIVSP